MRINKKILLFLGPILFAIVGIIYYHLCANENILFIVEKYLANIYRVNLEGTWGVTSFILDTVGLSIVLFIIGFAICLMFYHKIAGTILIILIIIFSYNPFKKAYNETISWNRERKIAYDEDSKFLNIYQHAELFDADADIIRQLINKYKIEGYPANSDEENAKYSVNEIKGLFGREGIEYDISK